MRFRTGASVAAVLCACGTAAIASAQSARDVHQEQREETRPMSGLENPPSLSERARGAESSLPVVVQRSINGDPELRRENVKVAANERRTVTLSGEVSSERLKDRAERIARTVSGVQHVHNDLVVRGTADELNRGRDAATTDHSDPAHEQPQRE